MKIRDLVENSRLLGMLSFIAIALNSSEASQALTQNAQQLDQFLTNADFVSRRE